MIEKVNQHKGDCLLNMLSQPSELQEDARLVIDVMSEKEDVTLDFSVDSISWLDTYINQHRNDLSDNDKQILREKFGAFVGEAIRHTFGGQWVQADDEWMIGFNDDAQTSPFEMVSQQLYNKVSLTSLVQRIPELFDPNAPHN